MANLRIGRLGATIPVELLLGWGEQVSGENRVQVILSGVFRAPTIDETRTLRDELVSLADGGFVVPVTWDADASLAGFYRVVSSQVDHEQSFAPGLVTFEVTLERRSKVGLFSSRLTGGLRANQHNLVRADVEPIVAPPPDADNFDAGATVPASILRNSVDGNVRVYLDIVPADFDDPEWRVAPADYYKAAAKIVVDSRERSGLWCPNVLTGWELSNGLVRVKPGTGSRLTVEFFDGVAWESLKTLRIGHTGTGNAADAFTEVEDWNAIVILRNDAEVATIRLEGQIASPRRRWTLDLTLRRGSRFVEGRVVSSDSVQDVKVVLSGTEAGTAITAAVRATSNDAGGNRYVVGSSRTFTADTTSGGVEKSSVGKLDFFVGAEVGGSNLGYQDIYADAYKTDADLAEKLVNQYLGYLDEHVELIA